MKKTLISAENVHEFICSQTNKLYHTNAYIITAGAKDVCSKNGTEIVYGASGNSFCAAKDSSITYTTANASATNSSMKNLLVDASNPKAPSCCAGVSNDPFDQLLVKLAVVIRELYGITDLVELRQKAMDAAKTIYKNL